MSIYKNFESAKNGTQIPVFQSGRTMESRYNPERDSENLLNTITEQANIFLVLGTGSGIFISLLSQKFPSSKIITFELSSEDFDFLKSSEKITSLNKNPHIIFACLENIEQILSQNYIPARDGNLKIIEQKAWINENSAHIYEINQVLKKALGIISADYSVQVHFGKIWNSNIINNSILAEKLNTPSSVFTADCIKNKTAVVVAAGPSLNRTLEILTDKSQRENYFIFSTDTAAQTLKKKGISPEVIVSIDGQAVSYNHFISNDENKNDETVYAFDLCANASAARYLYETGHKLFFFCSGHPLSSAINLSSDTPLPQLFSGAGTVTITALDFALQAGFNKIIILGADFSYQNGRAYASGTYLDTLYNQNSSRLTETEQTFSRLMFRTELKELSANIKTTEILEAYRVSLEKYLAGKNVSFSKKEDIYYLETSSKVNVNLLNPNKTLSLKSFMKKFNSSSLEEKEPLLLPYIAWLRNNENFSTLDYSKLLKLALDSIVSYNI